MSRIASLSPEFAICRRIPDGAFSDSALVWMYRPELEGISEHPFAVEKRVIAEYLKREMYPAPTLEEVIEELDKRDRYENKLKICPVFPGGEWSIGYSYKRLEKDFDLTAAALRLWFKVKGINLE